MELFLQWNEKEVLVIRLGCTWVSFMSDFDLGYLNNI